MDKLKVFKELVDKLYNSIPKDKLQDDSRAKIVNLLLDTKYGKGLDGLTLQEIGSLLGVTRERIRQVEEGAIKKLRHPTTGKKLLELQEYSHMRWDKPYHEIGSFKDVR